MTGQRRFWLPLVLTMSTFALAFAAPAAPAGAQPDQRCFTETGFCIGGAVLAYWERNGGLEVFGYPISAQQQETVEGRTLPVQWFERDRLEIQTDGTVTAGRLGARYLELAGRPWQPGATRDPRPGCRWFALTGHEACGPMLAYWETNGGVERFGYPLTSLMTEVIEGREYQVQYFERRRMEVHPEPGGTSARVLLGRLGAELYRLDGKCLPWFFEPAPALCPLAAPTSSAGAAQRFEHGVMLWTQTPDAFTIVLDDGRYWTAQAPFRFATPAIVPEDAPPGRFVPVSGFGDVWRGRIVVEGPWPFQEPLFTVLGWAIEPERGLTVATQCQRARAYEEQRCYMGSADGPVVFYGPGSWGVVR